MSCRGSQVVGWSDRCRRRRRHGQPDGAAARAPRAAKACASTFVAVNAPYRPAFVGRIRGCARSFRLVPYVRRCGARRDRSTSFTSWRIPAGRGTCSRRPRSGSAACAAVTGRRQLSRRRAPRRSWQRSRALVALDASRAPTRSPSRRVSWSEVFARASVRASSRAAEHRRPSTRFRPRTERVRGHRRKHPSVARNLEPIYDIATALRAFAIVVRERAACAADDRRRRPRAAARLSALAARSRCRRCRRVLRPRRPRADGRAVSRSPTSCSIRAASTTCRIRCSRRSRAACRSSAPMSAASPTSCATSGRHCSCRPAILHAMAAALLRVSTIRELAASLRAERPCATSSNTRGRTCASSCISIYRSARRRARGGDARRLNVRWPPIYTTGSCRERAVSAAGAAEATCDRRRPPRAGRVAMVDADTACSALQLDSAARAADGCRARRAVLPRAVRATAGFDPAKRQLARRPRTPAVSDQGPHPRAHRGSLKSRAARQPARFNTGGSSGEPLVFFLGARARQPRRGGEVARDALVGRRYRRSGNRRLGLADRARRAGPGSRRCATACFAPTLLPAFEMSRSRGSTISSQRIRDAAAAHAVRLSVRARAHRATCASDADDRRSDDLGIKVAFVTSERLYDDQRATHRAGLRLPRGQRLRRTRRGLHRARMSGGRHAHHRGRHRSSRSSTEAGEPLPPGHSGEIVVTHLAHRATFRSFAIAPAISASSRPAACPCGRGLAAARADPGPHDRLRGGADGTVMHGLALIYVVRDLPGIESFKIVQETAGLTRVFARARARLRRGGHGADPRRVAGATGRRRDDRRRGPSTRFRPRRRASTAMS